MLKYKSHLKPLSRILRNHQTSPEKLLWFYLRKKQVASTLFTRQKPIGPYIVDFYAHSAKLVIELDGSQHYDNAKKLSDLKRDEFLKKQGLKVLRFNNIEVIFNTEMVMRVIECCVEGRPYTYKHGEYVDMY